MKYQKALILYRELKNYLKRVYNMNVTMVGSLKRKEDDIHDIDLLTSDKLFNTNRSFIQFKYNDINVDIWLSKNIKFAKIMRSFNKRDSIVLRAVAKNKGYNLNNDGLFANGKRIDVKNKRELLRILEVHHIK